MPLEFLGGDQIPHPVYPGFCPHCAKPLLLWEEILFLPTGSKLLGFVVTSQASVNALEIGGREKIGGVALHRECVDGWVTERSEEMKLKSRDRAIKDRWECLSLTEPVDATCEECGKSGTTSEVTLCRDCGAELCGVACALTHTEGRQTR